MKRKTKTAGAAVDLGRVAGPTQVGSRAVERHKCPTNKGLWGLFFIGCNIETNISGMGLRCGGQSGVRGRAAPSFARAAIFVTSCLCASAACAVAFASGEGQSHDTLERAGSASSQYWDAPVLVWGGSSGGGSAASRVAIDAEPVAHPSATMYCGDDVRITALTPRVIRAEYSAAGRAGFEDRATTTYVHRRPTLATPTVAISNATKNACNITATWPDGQFISASYRRADTGSCSSSAGREEDVVCDGPCERVTAHPNGVADVKNASLCCSLCSGDPTCRVWVYSPDDAPQAHTCWLLTGSNVVGTKPSPTRHSGGIPDPFGEALVVMTSGGVNWTAPRDGGTNDTSDNLNGTRLDLAGCCHNPTPANVPGAGAHSTGFQPDPLYPLEAGPLSRAGVAALDDTSPAVDAGIAGSSQAWVSRTRGSPTDRYIYACGTDYETCLGDYTALTGPISMPHPAALGLWWSRHWGNTWDGQPFGPETQSAIEKEVIQGYKSHGLPLNIVVADMEWHTEVAPPDCKQFIGIKGWGGFTWNKTLFADPAGWVQSLHERDLHILLNIHPDAPLDNCQTAYPTVAAALGMDPHGTEAITLDFNNKTIADAYYSLVIPEMHSDWLWVDSRTVTTWKNTLNTRWLRTGPSPARPMALARWGGPGSHRYPIGFSGDTLRLWDTLEYEVWFTQRAASVAFGWWSHDIAGFSGATNSNILGESPELNLRWLQFATFAPIFRSHCRYCDQRIWTEPLLPLYPYLKAAMLRRNELGPYIYTQGWRAYQRGVAVVHPTEFSGDTAKLPEAYNYSLQYRFGQDFLVAPVTSPVDPATNTTADKDVWLPPGAWVRWNRTAEITVAGAAGEVISGKLQPYGLADVPVWVRAGACVPTKTMASVAPSAADPLVWQVWASHQAVAGSGVVFEDDGDTFQYEEGAHALTTLSFVRDGTQVELSISPTIGAYLGQPSMRNQTLRLLPWPAGSTSPSVALNGTAVPNGPVGGSGKTPQWWIQPVSTTDDGSIDPASLVVQLGPLSKDAGAAVSVKW